jgi:glutamate synthase domain-containing protein 2
MSFSRYDLLRAGVSLDDLLTDVLTLHHEAGTCDTPELTEHGFVRYRRGKERHANSPEVFVPLMRKVLAVTPLEEERYAKLLTQRTRHATHESFWRS